MREFGRFTQEFNNFFQERLVQKTPETQPVQDMVPDEKFPQSSQQNIETDFQKGSLK